MKKYFAFLPALLAALMLTSCSSNKQQEQTTTPPADTTTTTGGNLMTEGPAYDPTKVDPSAPVVEIVLKAQGNTMTDMSYDKKELRVKAGSTVHLTLINEGTDAAMVHNFVLIEEGTADKVGPEGMKAGPDNNYTPKMRQVLVGTKMVQPKGKEEITFPAPEKGTYDYICTYPGHYQKMNGKFFVE